VSYSCLGVLVDALALPLVDADLLLLCLSSPLSEVDGLRCTERARDEERGRDDDRGRDEDRGPSFSVFDEEVVLLLRSFLAHMAGGCLDTTQAAFCLSAG